MKWFKRWHKIGYRELWSRHFGGAHEGDKGCEREYQFLLEVMGGWKHAFEDARSLRIESDELLKENGIESPTDKRYRELMERLKEKRTIPT